MKAPDFMTADVITATGDMSVREATRRVLHHRVAALPVVDDGRLIGIVSELDLLRGRLPVDPRARARPAPVPTSAPPSLVRDVMTADVVALTEADDAASFASLLASSGFKSLPVVRGDRLVGIVGRRDLLRLLSRRDAEIEHEVRRLLADALGRAGWSVSVHGGVVRLAGGGTDDEHVTAGRLLLTVPGVIRVQVEGARDRQPTA